MFIILTLFVLTDKILHHFYIIEGHLHMDSGKKIYSIKLTDINKDKVHTFFSTPNTNLINFYWRTLLKDAVDLSTCDYMADIDEEEEGIVETIGISEKAYTEAIARFKNMQKDGLI